MYSTQIKHMYIAKIHHMFKPDKCWSMYKWNTLQLVILYGIVLLCMCF